MTTSCRKPGPPPPPVSDAGFEKLGPPRPGEWLHTFKEDGQTFEDYVGECANRKSAERGVFYIQPLGAASDRYRETLERMREYAEIFFALPARICDPIPMFENGYVPQRSQYNSTMIMGQLAERVPKDAIAYVGITDQDLFARGLNFVFGQGSLQDRTGVYSLTRFETDDRTLFLRRSLNLMAHEVGHIFSVEHCIYYKCVMQGANSLDESDGHPMHLCPIDLRKLEWNLGFDRSARYRKLRDFYVGSGLNAEAEWVGRRLGY